jgi:hypothetical protein
MAFLNRILAIFILFIFIIPLFNSVDSLQISGEKIDEKIIRIAQYPRETGSDLSFEIIFNYTWIANNTLYKFTITELTLEEMMGNGKNPLNISNFDLLLVGVSFKGYTRDYRYPELFENVREFLFQGGGYLGICAGATRASHGFENPRELYKKHSNRCVFKIANVYVNTDLNQESQYIHKCASINRINQGLIPIEKKVLRNNSNPIFADYPFETINITYGGGPALYNASGNDPNLGEITPLLVINEELMNTKPINWYVKGLLPFAWWKLLKVKTDMYGQYGGIATTYGLGRVVLYTGQPEIQVILNGTIEEGPGRSTGYGIKFPRYRVVYSWVGTPMNMSYNWWIHRRSAAWIAGIPDDDIPPCNEFMVFMDKPQFRFGPQLFIKDQQIGSYFNFSLLGPFFNFPWLEKSFLMKKVAGKFVSKRLLDAVSKKGKTIIIGDITIEAYAENCEKVEFYVDGELKFTDTDHPFEWKLDTNNLDGLHSLELRAYDEYGSCARDGSEFLFYDF